MPKFTTVPPVQLKRLIGAGLLTAGFLLYRKYRDKLRPPAKPDPTPARLKVSSPDQPRPTLVDVRGLNERVDYGGQDLPPFPADASGRGSFRIVELFGIDAETFVVHVYNGSPVDLPLQVYGLGEEGRAVPLREELASVDRVVLRVEVTARRRYPRYFVRFSLGSNAAALSSTNLVSLAVYTTEPKNRGTLRHENERLLSGRAEELLSDLPVRPRPLTFSHEDNTFQSVVLSACDEEVDLDELLTAIDRIGLPVTDAYFGELGYVIILGLDEGVSPNTSGGGTHIPERAREKPPRARLSPNYVVNQRDPANPQHVCDPVEQPAAAGDFSLPVGIDPEAEPLTIAVIDGGVDLDSANQRYWAAGQRDRPRETELVRNGQLGYDFIDKDGTPNDVMAHGTYVAGAILGGYRGKRPLSLLHFKIFGEEGISSYFGALVGIYEAATLNAKVINMSWGLYAPQAPSGMECAIDAAIRRGCFLVVSAGNDGRNLDVTPQWPAAFAEDKAKNVISVGSYRFRGDWNGTDVVMSDFSNYSNKRVSLAAYESALVPELGGNRLATPVGTSLSAPLVTATLAGILSDNPKAQVGTLYSLVERSLRPVARAWSDSYLPVDRGADTGLTAQPEGGSQLGRCKD